jgi:predicted Fe-Mo cluster-binding NifX family protein
MKLKIAISSTGKNIEDNVSDVFGRCPYFVIAEIENGEIKRTEIIENKSTGQMSGAGISAAQLMAGKNVNAVITGNVGPRALDALEQFDIKVYSGSGAIKEVLQEFMDGKLKNSKDENSCSDKQ